MPFMSPHPVIYFLQVLFILMGFISILAAIFFGIQGWFSHINNDGENVYGQIGSMGCAIVIPCFALAIAAPIIPKVLVILGVVGLLLGGLCIFLTIGMHKTRLSNSLMVFGIASLVVGAIGMILFR